MNISVAQNEEEPSWITRLLFVILNYHLSGNHSTIATQTEGTGIKILSCYHCTHFYKVIYYVNQNNRKQIILLNVTRSNIIKKKSVINDW